MYDAEVAVGGPFSAIVLVRRAVAGAAAGLGDSALGMTSIDRLRRSLFNPGAGVESGENGSEPGRARERYAVSMGLMSDWFAGIADGNS